MLCSLLSALPRDRGARRDPVSPCPNAWAVPPDLQGASADRVKRLGGQRPWSPHWNTTAASALQAVVARLNASAAPRRPFPPPLITPPRPRRRPARGGGDVRSPTAPPGTAGAAAARRPA